MADLYSQIQEYEKGQATKFPTSGTIHRIDGGFVDVAVRGSSSILRNVRCVGSPSATGQAVILTWENGVPTAHMTDGSIASTPTALVRGPQGPTGPQGPAGPTGPAGPAGSWQTAAYAEFVEQSSAPAAPPAGSTRLYVKPDHKVYIKPSDNVETAVGVTDHNDLQNRGANTHAQIDAHISAVGGPNAHNMREVLTAARTYYVRTDGSDSNNGLSNTAGGAFLTIQKAINVVTSAIDFGGQGVTIQIAAGTYTGFTLSSAWTGGGTLSLLGNTGSPQNVILTSAASISCTLPGTLSLAGMELRNSGGDTIYHAGAGTVQYSYIRFGACANFHVSGASPSALLHQVAPCWIVGNAVAHWVANTGSLIRTYSQGLTFSAGVAFSFTFTYITRNSVLECNGITFSGTFTGSRFLVDSGGIIYAGANQATYFPGTALGTVGTGGQWI